MAGGGRDRCRVENLGGVVSEPAFVSLSLILVVGRHGHILGASGLHGSLQAMLRVIRRTKLKAPASVFRRALGLIEARPEGT